MITFKARIETIRNADDTIAYERIKVPRLDKRHCNMAKARQHPRLGSYVNSDLLPGMLRRMAAARGVIPYIRLDQLPDGVRVDATGFLAEVSIDL